MNEVLALAPTSAIPEAPTSSAVHSYETVITDLFKKAHLHENYLDQIEKDLTQRGLIKRVFCFTKTYLTTPSEVKEERHVITYFTEIKKLISVAAAVFNKVDSKEFVAATRREEGFYFLEITDIFIQILTIFSRDNGLDKVLLPYINSLKEGREIAAAFDNLIKTKDQMQADKIAKSILEKLIKIRESKKSSIEESILKIPSGWSGSEIEKEPGHFIVQSFVVQDDYVYWIIINPAPMISDDSTMTSEGMCKPYTLAIPSNTFFDENVGKQIIEDIVNLMKPPTSLKEAYETLFEKWQSYVSSVPEDIIFKAATYQRQWGNFCGVYGYLGDLNCLFQTINCPELYDRFISYWSDEILHQLDELKKLVNASSFKSFDEEKVLLSLYESIQVEKLPVVQECKKFMINSGLHVLILKSGLGNFCASLVWDYSKTFELALDQYVHSRDDEQLQRDLTKITDGITAAVKSMDNLDNILLNSRENLDAFCQLVEENESILSSFSEVALKFKKDRAEILSSLQEGFSDEENITISYLDKFAIQLNDLSESIQSHMGQAQEVLSKCNSESVAK